MSTGGEYQEPFQKGEDRNVTSAWISYYMREPQEGVEDMNIKARYGKAMIGSGNDAIVTNLLC